MHRQRQTDPETEDSGWDLKCHKSHSIGTVKSEQKAVVNGQLVITGGCELALMVVVRSTEG